jgi:2-polyprenyl-6-methoxyphenol hydroxylase-like FAD-dependent oxidoreductase
MRIGETRYRWEFRLRPGETAADYASIADLRPLIARWVKDAPTRDLELVRVAEYTFRAQLADRWRDRNIFILGDAAHLTPPFIGQGMGAGLRDAANLSWKLAGVLSGSLPPSVLDTYEQETKTTRPIHDPVRAGDGLGAARRPPCAAPRWSRKPGHPASSPARFAPIPHCRKISGSTT